MTLPAPPAPRIPYDRDGTIVFAAHSFGDDRTPYALSPGAVEGLNADLSGGLAIEDDFWAADDPAEYYYAPNYIALLFPHPTDLHAWFISAPTQFFRPSIFLGTDLGRANFKVQAQISNDTTNGLDGTWTVIDTKMPEDFHLTPATFTRIVTITRILHDDPNLLPADIATGEQYLGAHDKGSDGFRAIWWGVQAGEDVMYRDDGMAGPGWSDLPSPAMGVRGFRLYFPERPAIADAESLRFGSTVLNLHLYGRRQAVTANRLGFVGTSGSGDPDLSFGDVDVEETAVRSFRVKNFSGSLDAQRVAIYTEESSIESLPSIVSQLQLSLNGEDWRSSVEVPAILAGEASDLIYVRFNPGSSAIGRKFARVGARAREWS